MKEIVVIGTGRMGGAFATAFAERTSHDRGSHAGSSSAAALSLQLGVRVADDKELLAADVVFVATPPAAYICQSVSDRKELEAYWKDMPRTFMGFDFKLHTAYRPFQLLEGEGPVEGVVVAEFPSMEEAKRWYDSPGYVAVRQHRMRGAKYLGLLVDGGVTESIDERMSQTRRKS